MSLACRPTAQEVDDYANLIAESESAYAEPPEALRRQAELQLWIWRTESRRKRAPAKRRRT